MISSIRPLIILATVATLVGWLFNPLQDFLYSESVERGLIEQSDHHKHETESTKLPLPVLIVERYKEQHNVKVLEQEDASGGLHPTRQYAIAPYWCPERAGNILHNLFNTVTWAIITNRTILLQWDHSNPNRNTAAHCEHALHLKPWVPLWDEWKDRISSNTIVPIAIDVTRRRFDEIHTVVMFPQIPGVLHERGDEIYRNSWSDHPFHPDYERYIEDCPELRKTMARDLNSLTVDFLYGMLFRQMFLMIPEQVTSGRELIQKKRSDSFTVALHSRHVGRTDDGSIFEDEAKCLSRLMNEVFFNISSDVGSNHFSQQNTPETNSYTSCDIYLLSDRAATVEKLSEWMQQEYPICYVHRTEPSAAGKDQTTIRAIEHGPHPGIGFFRDLTMGAQARTAIIGDEHHSSYKLLHELVTYDRTMERVNAAAVSSNVWPKPLLHCHLPQRPPTGYNYGPGSHTYIQLAESLPELRPMKLWRLFRQRHSQHVLEQEYANAENETEASWIQSGRLYSVANITCPLSMEEDSTLSLLNRIMWSIISNRTVLVQAPSQFSHQCLKRLPAWIPRWDEWSKKANLPNAPERPSVDSRVLVLPSVVPSSFSRNRSKTRSTVAGSLFEYGSRFVYGMISRDMFKELMGGGNNAFQRRSPYQIMNPSVYSIAMDTRSLKNLPDSPDDKTESSMLQCVTKILSYAGASSPTPLSCRIYLLSTDNRTAFYWRQKIEDQRRKIMDKKTTNMSVASVAKCKIQTLPSLACSQQQHKQQHHQGDCSTITSSSNDNNNTDPSHVAYWDLWRWASRARDAWIGPEWSLILNEIEFERVMEARSLGRFPLELPELDTCYTGSSSEEAK